MLNVIDLVTSIMEMDKELEKLRVENTTLKAKKEKVCSCNETVKEQSEIDKYIYNTGLEFVYKKMFYDWNQVSASRNENGQIVYTSFENYRNKELRSDYVPLNLSKQEIFDKLDDILRKKYQDSCEDAYKRLLEKEKEEREEDE